MLDLLVVTGGSRGIGASIATECAPLASQSVLIGSSELIHAKAQSCPNAISVQVDLAHFEDAKSKVVSAIGNSRPMSIGVALCAATLGSPGGLLDGRLDEWERAYKCNVLGNLAVLSAVLSVMPQGASLRVVFLAGGGAAYGYPEFSGYALSKVAVVRAVENIGLEFTSKGLDASIIALAPGAVETDMLKTVIAHGGSVKTRTAVSEPTMFVRKFLTNGFPSSQMNGRFIHVRDAIQDDISLGDSHFKLRRVE